MNESTIKLPTKANGQPNWEFIESYVKALPYSVSLQGKSMSDKSPAQKGRPVTNKMGQIPATPEDIAKAIFRSADKKIKKQKPKPN